MNFFPFHIGDYAFHTRHLSLMEDLAYRRVLDLYYSRDGVLPESGVARLVGMTGHEAEVETILGEFFPNGVNKRADEEITKMRAKQENARASVAKRTHVTQAPRERDASVIEASTTNNQEPVTKNQEKEPTVLPAPSLRSVTAPPAFDGGNGKEIPVKAVVPLSATFDLPDEWGVDAEALGFPRSKVLFESERYRQFWAKGKGAGRRKSLKGWRQAWSNWLGKAAERAA